MTRALVLAVAAVCTWSCSHHDEVVIGSKNFTEQVVLGEMAAQQLERKLHLNVTRKLNLGGTLLAHEALVKGDISLYPEYTGTASSAVLKQKVPDDPARAYMQVKDEYLERFHLVWLPPIGFNDTFAMVVRSEDARKLTSPQLSSANARAWRLGVGYEFLTRQDGLSRLNQVYQLRLEGTAQTMDLGLLYKALEQRKIDMAAANSTDGLLENSRFTVLSDDKKAFPPYNACFVLREDLAKQHPEIKLALTMLSGMIGDQAMRKLNHRVDVDHQPVERVVKDFLATQP